MRSVSIATLMITALLLIGCSRALFGYSQTDGAPDPGAGA